MLTGLQCNTLVECFEAALDEVSRSEPDKASMLSVYSLIAKADVVKLSEKIRELPSGGYKRALEGVVDMLAGEEVPFNLKDLNEDVAPEDVHEYCETLLSVMKPVLGDVEEVQPERPVAYEALDGFLGVATALTHPVQTVTRFISSPSSAMAKVIETCQSRPVKMLASTGTIITAACYTAFLIGKDYNKTVNEFKFTSAHQLAEPLPSAKVLPSMELPVIPEKTAEALHPGHVRFLSTGDNAFTTVRLEAPPSSLPSSKKDLVCMTGAATAKRVIVQALRRALM